MSHSETPCGVKELAAAKNAARKKLNGADWVLITPLDSVPED